MNFQRAILFISLFCTSTNTSPDNSHSEDDDASHTNAVVAVEALKEKRKKRSSRCPSIACHELVENHDFGPPSRLCPGRQAASSNQLSDHSQHADIRKGKQKIGIGRLATPPAIRNEGNYQPSPVHFELLRKELANLEAEEQVVLASIQSEEENLHRQIAERQARIQRLRGNNISSTVAHTSAPPVMNFQAVTSNDTNVMSSLLGAESANNNIPSNNNIRNIPSVRHLGDSQQQSLAAVYRHQEQRSSELFLRPSRSSDTGQGKPLRVVDFVSRLCPVEEEKVISTDSGYTTKLMLSFGGNKVKLESITIEQFNIANLRIFYELLSSNKLPTSDDLRDYLSYSIKVLELARKYTWESVLKYDDEYRILQHTYGYQWSFDNSHLHEVMLIPRWAVSTPGNRKNTYVSVTPSSGSASSFNAPGHGSRGQQYQDSAPPIVSHTVGGQEICRNFNRMKGCQRSDCKFPHSCNRKIAGRACGKPHSASNHNNSSDQ